MICNKCNSQNDFRNEVCFNCNAPLYNPPQSPNPQNPDDNSYYNDQNNEYYNYQPPEGPPPANYYNNNYYQNYPYVPKSRLAALLFCIFLGVFGIHRFYVGKVGTGLLYLFTAGFFGIGVVVDIILIATGVFTDKRGFPLI